MPGSTPIYGFPYLVNEVDPPDIGGATQALAERAEFQVARLDGAMVGFESASEVSPQSIPAAAGTPLRWQAATSNVGGFGKPNTTEWTVPTGGVYAATVQGLVSNGQSGRAFAQVVMANREFRTPFGGAGESGWGAAGIRRLTAGAVIRADLYCATATTVSSATLVVYRIGS
ncbi:hypothetical protein [Micromonospora tarensis]|uniref:Minor tail protein n=1 Tax=Micromonospora tarensis TaxID=2806100 RepID=A0ABS1Y9T6_9ACTN|nr:hypothetical protein [Micromonospora tarensis]MBM0274142.1 hypothetical protein [Micromonospora tarensis]